MAEQIDAEQAERFSSLALFLVLFLLMGSFLTSYYLKVKRITAVHETIVGLFAGMFVGLVLRIGPLERVRDMLSFSNTIMLNVLLPPIILSSGYDLSQAKFFRNFGTILAFAFFGTFMSAVVIGLIVWLASMLRIEHPRLSLLDALIYGSTLSATDPVTILAIFNTYKVDPQLYSIIFGESILNDAVSIVMFDTLSQMRGAHLSIMSVLHGFGFFAVVFNVSMALGVLFGLFCSLLLKHTRLRLYKELECCVVLLVAYTSYFFSNAVEMSGIVSLLFCGITLKHYAYHNMSRRTQHMTKGIFQTLSNLSENFIFIYLGLSMFTGQNLVYQPLLIVCTLGAVVVSRYCSVFSIAWALNAWSEWRAARRQALNPGLPHQSYQLPHNYQLMLFWAGLRGAVGFALSEGIVGANAHALQTTVLVVVVLTVIVFGGTTAQMLDVLQIQTGVQDEEAESSDDDLELDAQLRLLPDTPVYENAQANRSSSTVLDANEILPTVQSTSNTLPQAIVAGPGGLRSVSHDELDMLETDEPNDRTRSARAVLDQAQFILRDGQWFQRIDERYLLPMFSNTVASRKHEQRKEQLQARRATRDRSVSETTHIAVPYRPPEAIDMPDSGRISPNKNKQH